jgi:hypothetical protein
MAVTAKRPLVVSRIASSYLVDQGLRGCHTGFFGVTGWHMEPKLCLGSLNSAFSSVLAVFVHGSHLQLLVFLY